MMDVHTLCCGLPIVECFEEVPITQLLSLNDDGRQGYHYKQDYFSHPNT